MPFYFGIIETVIQYDAVGSKINDVPSYDAINIELLWGLRKYFNEWLSAKISCGPGIYQMSFEEDEILTEALLTEREISLNLSGSLLVKFVKEFGVEFGYSFTRIFTNTNIDLNYIYAGVNVSIRSPEWLVDILK